MFWERKDAILGTLGDRGRPRPGARSAIDVMLATMIRERQEYKTLSKAPITEALIDIQVQLPADTTIEGLRAFYDSEMKAQFPIMEERMLSTGQIQLKPAQPPEIRSAAPRPDGLLMRSDKDAFLVQARLDGFTVNKFHPYVTWTDLKGRTQKLWRQYCKTARPIKATRLAVRYTNRLEMEPGRDFKDFILTFPEIAPGIPQGLPEFGMRLVIPDESGCMAIVTLSSLHPNTNSETYPMMFDIDAFRYVDLAATEEDEIWSLLDELRDYKNLIFFKSITPELLEKYK